MKTKGYYLLMLFTFIHLSVTGQNEKRVFDLIHKDKIVGTLTANKIINGNETKYTSLTELEIHIFTKISVSYNYEVLYKNDVLNKGAVIVKVNGHEKTNVKTETENSQYSFYSNGKIVKNFDAIISNSVIMLFFEEPIGVSEIYAEEPGEFHKIEVIGNSYVKTAQSGHENIYTYKKGELKRVDVNGGIVQFHMILKKD